MFETNKLITFQLNTIHIERDKLSEVMVLILIEFKCLKNKYTQ